MNRPQIPDRIALLEARVSALENALGNSIAKQALARAARAPAVVEPACKEVGWERALGLTWLNRIGAAAVVLALLFAALWAHDHGLLSPSWRALLAVGASLSVLFAGLRLSASRVVGTRVFAYGVQAVGALGLYVTAFSAAHIDELIQPGQAMAAACLVTILLTALAQRFELSALANLAAVGGLGVPLYSGTQPAHFAPLFVFLSAQAFVHLWLARKRRWGHVALVQALGLGLYFLYLSSQARGIPGLGQCIAMSMVLGLFVVLYLRDELFADGTTPSDRLTAWLALLALLGCWALAEGPMSRVAPIALAVLASVAATALARLMHDHRSRPRSEGPALMVALALLVSGLAGEGAMQVLALAAPASLLALSLLREKDSSWLSLRFFGLLGVSGLSWMLCTEAVDTDGGRGAILLLALVLQTPLWWPCTREEARHLHGLAVFTGHGLGALGLVLGLRHASTIAWIPGPWFAISVVPALYGLALLWVGSRARDPWTRYGGLSLAVISAAKVVLYDLWSLSAGARVSVFLCLGLLLLGGSYLYSRAESEP